MTKKIHSDNPLVDQPSHEIVDILFNRPHTEEPAEYTQITEGELAELQSDKDGPEKDEEDLAIDKKIDDVYDSAIGAFRDQTEMVQIMDPRYAARNAEVAANYLSIALNAAATRARVKTDRKRNSTFVPYSNNRNPNGTVVATREDIMRAISVDADVKKPD